MSSISFKKLCQNKFGNLNLLEIEQDALLTTFGVICKKSDSSHSTVAVCFIGLPEPQGTGLSYITHTHNAIYVFIPLIHNKMIAQTESLNSSPSKQSRRRKKAD